MLGAQLLHSAFNARFINGGIIKTSWPLMSQIIADNYVQT